jgi:hypothetical protein
MSNKNSKKAVIGKLLAVCSGKRHAWYESDAGKIRKPYPLPQS